MYAKLKANRMTAMVTKNTLAKNLYSTMLGEVDKIAKDQKIEPTNAIVESVAKKMAGNLESNIAIYKERNVDYSNDQSELELVNEFLPLVLNEAATETIVSEIIKELGNPQMGQVMGALKQRCGNAVDMKIASGIVKRLLA